MKNNRSITATVITIYIAIFFSCTENQIPYDLSDSDLNIDTVTVRSIDGGTYLAPPLMGSADGLYFGNTDGFTNLFSLVQLSSLSLNGAVRSYSLLDSNITIDSVVVIFTATDSLIPTNSQFELYYFPEGDDSVFSETESNYLNITEADVLGAVQIGEKSTFKQGIADSIYPKLSFNFTEVEDLINFMADTTVNQNRTFMLRNTDSIDDIISIRSRETTEYPILNVYYRANEDTLHNVFFSMKDITIVKPPPINGLDGGIISISRAKGLKSILQFDLSDIPIDSNTIVIKSAELIFNSISEISYDDYEIMAAILDTSISISNYWEIDKDLYTIKQDVLMSGTFKNSQLKMEIRSFLQGVNTGSYKNFGLKLYSSSSSDPFQSINLVLDPINTDNNPYLKIVYVKL